MRHSFVFVRCMLVLAALAFVAGCVATGGSPKEQAAEALYADGDARSAYEQYLKLAEEGDAKAMFQVSRLLLEGKGVAQNEAAAMVWLQKASNGGCPRGKAMLGLYTLQGAHGISQNPQQGMTLLEEAAQAGDSTAAASLGAFYATGQGVVRNDATAAYWYSRARDMGYPIPPELTTAQGLASLDNHKPAKSPASSGPTGRAQVAEAQKLLGQLGYNPGPVDGIFGNRTSSAIMAFQRDKGMQADGKLTPQLLELIRFSVNQ